VPWYLLNSLRICCLLNWCCFGACLRAVKKGGLGTDIDPPSFISPQPGATGNRAVQTQLAASSPSVSVCRSGKDTEGTASTARKVLRGRQKGMLLGSAGPPPLARTPRPSEAIGPSCAPHGMEYRNKNISLNLEAASGAISNKPSKPSTWRGALIFNASQKNCIKPEC
jgi:hypothetical protein